MCTLARNHGGRRVDEENKRLSLWGEERKRNPRAPCARREKNDFTRGASSCGRYTIGTCRFTGAFTVELSAAWVVQRLFYEAYFASRLLLHVSLCSSYAFCCAAKTREIDTAWQNADQARANSEPARRSALVRNRCAVTKRCAIARSPSMATKRVIPQPCASQTLPQRRTRNAAADMTEKKKNTTLE